MVGLAALAVARWESFYLIYEEKINYKSYATYPWKCRKYNFIRI